jgi:NAD+ synthase (glutamine-hydrolysing)
MKQLRLGLAQINTTVGDFPGNLNKMLSVLRDARQTGIELVIFPELAICGYPPEDLILKPKFIETNLQYLNKLIDACSSIGIIAGYIESEGKNLFNSAAIIYNGKLIDSYHKILLPNYGVFDENRYFKAGNRYPVYDFGGTTFGVNICEDIWYTTGPAQLQSRAGAKFIINISASPYHYGKINEREAILKEQATNNTVLIAYTNLVGGQDELVFDGNSLVVSENGNILARGKPFKEDLVAIDIDTSSVTQSRYSPFTDKTQTSSKTSPCSNDKIFVTGEFPQKNLPPIITIRDFKALTLTEEIYNALVLGTRDYILKNGFEKVVIGLSGGVDSSLVATLAVDALGKKNVIGVAMPSRYSSKESLNDAQKLAKNLGITFITISIEKVFQAYLDSLADIFRNCVVDSTEENIQARIRGNFLMALSNKFNWLVLPTGNKSEMATGYATLYGDMAGGFAILKDVPKTLVYKLVEYRNKQAGFDLIPDSVIRKPPSAELRPNQRDTDSLPPYELLDPVLKAYVEDDKSVEQMIAMGLDEAVVRKAVKLVDSSEYKRRQSPPGIKITTRAFGRDRRLPITNKFKGNNH